jgi:hypothetical protein
MSASLRKKVLSRKAKAKKAQERRAKLKRIKDAERQRTAIIARNAEEFVYVIKDLQDERREFKMPRVSCYNLQDSLDIHQDEDYIEVEHKDIPEFLKELKDKVETQGIEWPK